MHAWPHVGVLDRQQPRVHHRHAAVRAALAATPRRIGGHRRVRQHVAPRLATPVVRADGFRQAVAVVQPQARAQYLLGEFGPALGAARGGHGRSTGRRVVHRRRSRRRTRATPRSWPARCAAGTIAAQRITIAGTEWRRRGRAVPCELVLQRRRRARVGSAPDRLAGPGPRRGALRRRPHVSDPARRPRFVHTRLHREPASRNAVPYVCAAPPGMPRRPTCRRSHPGPWSDDDVRRASSPVRGAASARACARRLAGTVDDPPARRRQRGAVTLTLRSMERTRCEPFVLDVTDADWLAAPRGTHVVARVTAGPSRTPPASRRRWPTGAASSRSTSWVPRSCSMPSGRSPTRAPRSCAPRPWRRSSPPLDKDGGADSALDEPLGPGLVRSVAGRRGPRSHEGTDGWRLRVGEAGRSAARPPRGGGASVRWAPASARSRRDHRYPSGASGGGAAAAHGRPARGARRSGGCGQDDELAAVVAFLLSDEASYLAGHRRPRRRRRRRRRRRHLVAVHSFIADLAPDTDAHASMNINVRNPNLFHQRKSATLATNASQRSTGVA